MDMTTKNPDLLESINSLDVSAYGRQMHNLIERLFPICRSITGDGVRETLQILRDNIPLEVHEVPTGTAAFDWTIPKEWNVRDAYIKNSKGRKVVDFQTSNLHLVSYSVPVHKWLSLTELSEHLHTDPDHPDWVPYRTSYYNETWGFCLAHNQFKELEEDEYEVLIDSELQDGSLTYGEFVLPGKEANEVLLFAHTCHPSLCNDNLSGIALVTYLAQFLSGIQLRYTYRFVFTPATIGSIAWLSRNEKTLPRIRHGLVASLLGDQGDFHYKRTYDGGAEIDRAVIQSLCDLGVPFEVREFDPWGYDERQFNSPGIRLPVGRLTRSPNGEFDEYHTSADNLEFVKPECLGQSLRAYLAIVNTLEANQKYRNLFPNGEPQLGRRGLYRKLGGLQSVEKTQLEMLWVLNCSDGQNSLLDIAERAKMPFSRLQAAARLLESNHLLEIVEPGDVAARQTP